MCRQGFLLPRSIDQLLPDVCQDRTRKINACMTRFTYFLIIPKRPLEEKKRASRRKPQTLETTTSLTQEVSVRLEQVGQTNCENAVCAIRNIRLSLLIRLVTAIDEGTLR